MGSNRPVVKDPFKVGVSNIFLPPSVLPINPITRPFLMVTTRKASLTGRIRDYLAFTSQIPCGRNSKLLKTMDTAARWR
ncbi:MAG: hypothetical protein MI921_10185 [Cytophagales bacterium]|nr:hypothetical protein [Cytophagales bacterium]